VAQGNFNVVLDEVASDVASTALRAVRILAQYLSVSGDKDEALASLQDLLKDAVAAKNPTLQIVASCIYEHVGDYEEALRQANGCRSLEGRAAMVQLYLRIDRPENAEKELRSMQQMDEDASLTQLSAARLALYSGGSKHVKDAMNIYDELIDKFGVSPTLLEGLAVCYMHSNQWDEAERVLKDALEKDPNNTTVLVNLATCSARLGKQSASNRYLSQIKAGNKNYWAEDLAKAESAFDAVL